jgi:guanylate kinase
MNASSPSRMLAVIGPSGSGKSSAVRMLARQGLLRVHPTWTTRPRRPEERDGSLEHRFVDDASFDELVASGFFLDSVALFGLPYRYGLPPIRCTTDGRIDTVMLRAPLVERFRQVVPRPLVVVQIEDEPLRIADRLHRRAASTLELRCRLEDNDRETVAGRALADRVLVNDGGLDELAEALEAAITFCPVPCP